RPAPQWYQTTDTCRPDAAIWGQASSLVSLATALIGRPGLNVWPPSLLAANQTSQEFDPQVGDAVSSSQVTYTYWPETAICQVHSRIKPSPPGSDMCVGGETVPSSEIFWTAIPGPSSSQLT